MGTQLPPAPGRLPFDVRLEVAERAAHHGVRDRGADDARHEAAGIDAQVELGARATVADRLEAPLAGEVAEVAADVLAAHAMRLVVDLAQRVADRPQLCVDDVLHDAAA